VADDTAILAAAHTTKNGTQTRDSDMKKTHNGSTWYFGTKLLVGTDRRGLEPSRTTAHVAAVDLTLLPHLMHGQETTLHRDRAYPRATTRDSGRRYRTIRRRIGHRTTTWTAEAIHLGAEAHLISASVALGISRP